eukprot:741233-Pelagomonas_calceolata.AAC.1
MACGQSWRCRHQHPEHPAHPVRRSQLIRGQKPLSPSQGLGSKCQNAATLHVHTCTHTQYTHSLYRALCTHGRCTQRLLTHPGGRPRGHAQRRRGGRQQPPALLPGHGRAQLVRRCPPAAQVASPAAKHPNFISWPACLGGCAGGSRSCSSSSSAAAPVSARPRNILCHVLQVGLVKVRAHTFARQVAAAHAPALKASTSAVSPAGARRRPVQLRVLCVRQGLTGWRRRRRRRGRRQSEPSTVRAALPL